MPRKGRPFQGEPNSPLPARTPEGASAKAPHIQAFRPPLQGDRPLVRFALVTVLVLATFFSYRRSLSSEFITLDDPWYVTANAQVQKGLDLASIPWAFTAFEASNWHPVTWLSHMLDIQLYGMDAGNHHLTSVLLHCANAFLLLLLLYRMTGALWRSALVALLFALHPLHVESVAWIAERKDVLSTFFWLLTLLAWMAYARSKNAGPYVLALVFFALGLMSKPMLVTLPFTLLLLDFWPLGRVALPLWGEGAKVKGLLREKAPFFAMAAASCAVTLAAQREAMQNLISLSLEERVANALQAYTGYLGKMVWPANLAVLYPYHPTALSSGSTSMAILLLASVTILSFALRRRAPYLSFGWFWYLGTLVPVIGLVQVGAQSMADRYTYVPLIGIFIALAWGLADLVRKKRTLRNAAAASAVGTMAVLFALTSVQSKYWTDSESLFSHALMVTSDNWVAHNCLGVALAIKGEMDGAITHYTEALRINPLHSDIHNNLAQALRSTGRLEEAVEQYRAALRLKPDSATPRRNLVEILLQAGRISEALASAREAPRYPPGNDQARRDLAMPLLKYGMELVGRKQFAEASSLFEQASGLVETLPPECLMQWGIALLGLNRYEEAAERFQRLLLKDAGSGPAHYELGYALSQLQRHAEALPHYRLAYGKSGVRSGAIVWIGDIYRQGGLCKEAEEIYRIISPGDPAYPGAASGITACGGKP